MANPEHVKILRQGVKAWNEWKVRNLIGERVEYDLSAADLAGLNLEGTNFLGVNLNEANLHLANLSRAVLELATLRFADLTEANMSWAEIIEADLTGAKLKNARLLHANCNKVVLDGADVSGASLGYREGFLGTMLTRASLRGTNLQSANLHDVNFTGSDLSRANLYQAELYETVLADVDLQNASGLESCRHAGPSLLDFRTLMKSGPLPLSFLRGCGLPDALIEYLPSLLTNPIEHYSCFISYSSKDQAFSERLHADLQNMGIRCWFAPEDMKIGDNIETTIERAIRMRDKLLLIFSESSVKSGWVEHEVRKAIDEEQTRGRAVLMPVRIDDAVMSCPYDWAHLVKRERHIGDFRQWKKHDAYRKSLDRLLRDLRADKRGSA